MRLLKLLLVSGLLNNSWANTECATAGGYEQAASLLQSRNAGGSDQRRPWRQRVSNVVKKTVEVVKKVVDKVIEVASSPEGQAVMGAVANTYFEEEIAEIDSLIETVDGHFIEFNAKKK